MTSRAFKLAGALVLVACSGSGSERSNQHALKCPPGTKHMGGRPGNDGEFCVEPPSRVRRHGPELMYHRDSWVIAEEGTWNHGIREGWWTRRWSNGRLLERGQYARDKQVGLWKRWGKDGKIVHERTYDENGELHGMSAGWAGDTHVEGYCYEHGRELWMTRDISIVGSVACPGPEPQR